MTNRYRPTPHALTLCAGLVAALLSACGGGGGDASGGTTASALSADSGGRESALAVSATAASTTLVVSARGDLANNIGPQMSIRINGVVVASAEVRATSYQNYSFTVPSMANGAALDIVYTNDGSANGVDRNLHVASFTANGISINVSGSGGTYDRGNGAAAFDGGNIIPAQSDMYWNGALRFNVAAAASVAAAPTPSVLDAVRLAQQATFGPNEALVASILSQGNANWINAQMGLSGSSYTHGAGDAIHKNTTTLSLCELPAYASATCTRDNYGAIPLLWDFYRNALRQPDQLRQRVTFALQQIAVISDVSMSGTYGFRGYYNTMLGDAFGNYRQVLKHVAMSPMMGDYLDNVDNDKAAPNENFGREFLQLFSVGTCQLNQDGSLIGGACSPTYDNAMVRNYAYALTGWTYPAGGLSKWGCGGSGRNCRYYAGDMVPAPLLHDTASRTLMSGVTVPSGSNSAQALDLVLDSVMNHPNMAPFISKQLIQKLVTSNPSPAYVQRVASAFASGRYSADGVSFGTDQRGDLKATVAAILLDAEARSTNPSTNYGKLREPVLLLTGALRAFNGDTDGDALGLGVSAAMNEMVFRPPSVFNFYSPTYPAPAAGLFGPEFGIHNTNTALLRLNYLSYLLYNGGTGPVASVPQATGTKVNMTAFQSSAADAAALVDRLSILAIGKALPDATRNDIIAAVNKFPATGATWKADRVNQAAFLVFASPNYQVQR